MEVFLLKLAIAWETSHMTIFLSTAVCTMYAILFPSESDKKAPVSRIIARIIGAFGFGFFTSSAYTLTLAMIVLFHAN